MSAAEKPTERGGGTRPRRVRLTSPSSRSVRPARSLAGDRCVDLALPPRRDGPDVLAPMICAHVLAPSAYSESARDRQIWAGYSRPALMSASTPAQTRGKPIEARPTMPSPRRSTPASVRAGRRRPAPRFALYASRITAMTIPVRNHRAGVSSWARMTSRYPSATAVVMVPATIALRSQGLDSA
jgi:hypothetical protein